MVLALQMDGLHREVLAQLNQRTDSKGSHQIYQCQTKINRHLESKQTDENFVIFEESQLELHTTIEGTNSSFWTLLALHLGALSILMLISNWFTNFKKTKQTSFKLVDFIQKGVGFYREQVDNCIYFRLSSFAIRFVMNQKS